VPRARAAADNWQLCLAHWRLREYDAAVDALAVRLPCRSMSEV
jgi:hypothetical protein